METTYCFREARNVEELYALLKLRYEEYRKSRLAGFCPENEYGLDIDGFDLRSRHFGLFQQGANGEKAIGYMRVVQTSKTESSSMIRDLMVTYAPNLVIEKTKVPLPTFQYLPEAGEKLEHITPDFDIHKCCEGSRFTIQKEHRSLRLARFFHECAISFSRIHFNYAFVGCCKSHFRFYESYGYVNLNDEDIYLNDKHSKPSIFSILDLKGLLKSLAIEKKVQQMSQQFQQYQSIRWAPESRMRSNPNTTQKTKAA